MCECGIGSQLGFCLLWVSQMSDVYFGVFHVPWLTRTRMFRPCYNLFYIKQSNNEQKLVSVIEGEPRVNAVAL